MRESNQSATGRRRGWARFLSGLMGLAGVGVGLACALGAVRETEGEKTGRLLERFAYERAEMGVPFRVTLYAEEEALARSAAEAALDRVRELNGVLSDYEEESELYRLSRSSGQGRAVPVSADLWRVLEAGQRMAERSGGAFDLTVGPVVNLWRVARRKRVLPVPERLADALERTGFRWVRLEAATRSVELLREGMRLDAGGVAKGYAVEEALKVLRVRGCARAMVQAGGDTALGEAPPREAGWRIEVPALDVEGAPGPRALGHLGDERLHRGRVGGAGRRPGRVVGPIAR